MGEEEKSPYFVQQSQQAAGQSQFSLATPQPAAPWDNPQQMAQTNQPQQTNTFGVSPAFLQGDSELPF